MHTLHLDSSSEFIFNLKLKYIKLPNATAQQSRFVSPSDGSIVTTGLPFSRISQIFTEPVHVKVII
jgi:hypothetical protein